MNISWVIADAAELDPTQAIEPLKRLGAFWGSWRTWRAYKTDNVICHDQTKAVELLQRQFQSHCNLYIPESVYNSLEQPSSVNIYAGDFVHDTDRQEEIVALHLAATTSDIVLLLGFDLTKLTPNPDKLLAHRAQHYRNLVRAAFTQYSNTQWVLVNHAGKLDRPISSCENVVTDNLENVLALIES